MSRKIPVKKFTVRKGKDMENLLKLFENPPPAVPHDEQPTLEFIEKLKEYEQEDVNNSESIK